jgi:photosystem II stability/assembly factor-like uncharacterized protein
MTRRSGLLAILSAAVMLVGCSSPSSSPVPWSRLGTHDAHSLVFAEGSTDHLLFGHHGGILESRDRGQTWSPLSIRADAMGMAVTGGSIYIAGHEVFMTSEDGGTTWSDVDAGLPSLDIHAFARDPANPERMWVYLAIGGLWESRDAGATWEIVYQGHLPQLVAVSTENGTELRGLDPFSGIVGSSDAGRTWSVLSTPPSAPVVSLAATPDGRIMLLGGGDGLYRSDDGGKSWSAPILDEMPLAISVSPDGRVIAAVTRSTDYYRSDDGGRTWPGPAGA